MIHDCYHQVFRNNHLLTDIKKPRQTRQGKTHFLPSIFDILTCQKENIS